MIPSVGCLGASGQGEDQANPGLTNPETRYRAASGEVTDPMLPRKASSLVGTVPVPQTNSGGRVENTKAIERTVVKELGKIPP